MSIKITYIFLKTLSITKDITIMAADGFNFNQKQPIKAIGNLHFIKENGKIITKKLDKSNKNMVNFQLPKILNKEIFKTDIEPLYILPAV